MPFGGYNPLDDGEYEDFSPWFKPRNKVMPENNPFKDDIVQRIDKLILGWEREYGITNKTMVDAMLTIIDLRSKMPGYDDLHTIIDRQEGEIEMMKAQLLIRKDQIEKLKSGPGGIMEMKQTIADKEAEIEQLTKVTSSDAMWLAAYHHWCKMNGCAPSSSNLITASKELENK